MRIAAAVVLPLLGVVVFGVIAFIIARRERARSRALAELLGGRVTFGGAVAFAHDGHPASIDARGERLVLSFPGWIAPRRWFIGAADCASGGAVGWWKAATAEVERDGLRLICGADEDPERIAEVVRALPAVPPIFSDPLASVRVSMERFAGGGRGIRRMWAARFDGLPRALRSDEPDGDALRAHIDGVLALLEAVRRAEAIDPEGVVPQA